MPSTTWIAGTTTSSKTEHFDGTDWDPRRYGERHQISVLRQRTAGFDPYRAENTMSRRAEGREARIAVAAEIQRLMEGRPTRTSLPIDIYMVALDGYEDGPIPASSLVMKCNRIAQKIRTEITGAQVTIAHRRSLSAERCAAVVMVFQARLRPMGMLQTLMCGWCDVLLLRPSGVAHLSTMEPVGASQHVLERVAQRSAVDFLDVTSVQEQFSLVWPALIELGQRRRRRGQYAEITYFLSPLGSGLVMANMSKFTGLPPGSNPQVIDFNRGQGTVYDLPDIYARGSDRLFVHIRTFIGRADMKQHQVLLYERLRSWVGRHQSVVEHLKLRARLAADVGSDGVADLMDIFGMKWPAALAIETALDELESLVLSTEWRDEIAFSRRLREADEGLH